MLCAEVDDTRRRAVESMTPAELREVVAETPRHPLAKRALDYLDLADAR
jgi:hypothetical protein